MTYWLRVTLLATVAVAVAILAASGLMYLVVQRQLVAQADQTLADTAEFVQALDARRDPRRALGPFGRATLISGRPDVFAQVVATTGEIPRADGAPIASLVSGEVKDVAAGKRASYTGDLFVKGSDGVTTYHVRIHAIPFGQGQALELARIVDEIDAALAEVRNILVGVAAAGVALAALLGAVVARGAIAPVTRLTRTVEEVARTRDLTRRVAATGRDELARLARSFDGMLIALEMSLRQQRQLVADASHELRTPLTSLRTNLELLARGHPEDPAERQQLLNDLVAQIERLSTLVSDLIDLARDEEAPLPVEDVRLDEVAATAIDEMRARYPQVKFRDVLRPTSIRGVRPRIARAVTNLLDNAAKWSSPYGVVEISVDGGEVVVRDHGPGISPEDSVHVFDRFWRAANARHLPGSGLGLSIVRQVAEAHGGSVTLEHPSDGGARFRLHFAAS
ncbi:MAG: HAMP domain-containing histidine kinase [Chloroflexi bacterium]|nr:HAMP domain-containing histidine kinase [Chloroflexota bacterium]